MALGFILEYKPDFDLLSITDEAQLRSYTDKSPPIASYLQRIGKAKSSDNLQSLSDFFQQQKKWRDEFKRLIKESSNSICIVGNAGSLLNKSVGELIDKHAMVIRFNNYCSDESLQKQCGKNIDLWVKSPDFHEPEKLLGVDVGWTIISGPDICYTMSDWSRVKLTFEKGGKVLTPPLELWQDLVRILKAPPSAGLLIIMWITQITGKLDGLSVAGFQSFSGDKQEQYHHSSSTHKAGTRHNWQEEKKLLRAWQKDGLSFLDKS